MKTFKHLKPELYYRDLYDRGTIDECRVWERVIKSSADDKKTDNAKRERQGTDEEKQLRKIEFEG